MRVLKSMVIAFSIYSKIPVPQFEWKEEDMKYMVCFFPWIGAVIGICLYLWHVFCKAWEVGGECVSVWCAHTPSLILTDRRPLR